VLVNGAGPAATGIVVDRVVGQREIVVRTISDPMVRVAGISGATDLGDGRVVLILDLPSLLGSSRRGERGAGHPAGVGPPRIGSVA
jgi:two-component system chemotaxis sensor kinase CheA